MSYAESQYVIDGVTKSLRDNPPPLGVEPNNLTGLKIIGGDGHIYIHFTPSDTVIENQGTLATEGVLIRRKVGEYPEDEFDGDLVLDAKGEHLYAYKSSPYMDDGLENGVEYFYRLFPYNSYNMINRSMVNSGSATPKKASIWGFHQDFTVLDPSESITYIGAAEGFTPMMVCSGDSTSTAGANRTLGSWKDWVWFKKNKPFRVYIPKAGGVGYARQLMSNNHGKLIGGDDSYLNRSNENTRDATGCQFHDYVWFPKIYMKEVYADDGESRDVYFAMEREGDTADFIPVGFYNKSHQELNGLWIAASWPSLGYHTADKYGYKDGKHRLHITYDDVYSSDGDVSYNYKYLYNAVTTTYAAFLGGPILNLIRDLMYMLFKTTDIQSALGKGRSSSYSGALSMPVYQSLKDLNGFVGHTSYNNPVFAFHTRTLAEYDKAILDPYTMVVGADVYINDRYNHSTEPSGYIKTPIRYPSASTFYPRKLAYCGDGLGSLPVSATGQGSTTTGLADLVSPTGVTEGVGRYAHRFGKAGGALANGPANISFPAIDMNSTQTGARIVPILLPAAGFEPDFIEES